MFTTIRDQKYDYVPISVFNTESLKEIVNMLNYVSNERWVYIANESNGPNAHFKLEGVLSIRTVALMTSKGAPIIIEQESEQKQDKKKSMDVMRIYEIDHYKLQTYFNQKKVAAEEVVKKLKIGFRR